MYIEVRVKTNVCEEWSSLSGSIDGTVKDQLSEG